MGNAETFDGVGTITHGDVFIMLWRDGTRQDQTRWVFERVEAHAAKHPSGTLVFQLILPTSSLPDGSTRADNQKRLKVLSPQLRRIVTVPLGDAIWLSLVRTTMRGIAMVSGCGKTQLVADDEASGLDALLQAAGRDTPPRHELAHRIDDLYRALDVAHRPLSIA